MTRETVLVLLGILVAVSPFLGLPLDALAWALPVLGLAIAGIGITLRSRRRAERLRRDASVPAEPPAFS